MEITRREFIKQVAPILFAPMGLEALAGETEEDRLSYLDVYDHVIDASLEYFAGIHARAPERNLIKAIIAVETGSGEHRKTAFVKDPMQIANKGDFALDVLSQRRDSTHLIGDFSILEGKRQTPFRKNQWDYSDTNMDAVSSIFGGIGWFYHKAALHDTRIAEFGDLREYEIEKGDTYYDLSKKLGTTMETLRKYNPGVEPKKLLIGRKIKYKQAREESFISDWRNWEETVKRYNGKDDPNYLDKVMRVKRALDRES